MTTDPLTVDATRCTCKAMVASFSRDNLRLLFMSPPRTEDVMEKRGIVNESTPTDRPVDERSGEKTAADAREDHPATRLAEIVAAELRAKTTACMRVTPDTRAPASG